MKQRRSLAWLLALAMVFSMVMMGVEPLSAKAAAIQPNSGAELVSNELTVSGDALVSNSDAHVGDSYNGYIQSNQGDKEYYASDYVKITYTVSGEVTADTKLFILQTYDTSWGGWSGIEVSIGMSSYDYATGIYTAYIPTAQLLATLTTGNELNGVNISFMQAEPAVTLVSYETVNYPDFAAMEEINELSANGDSLVSDSSAHVKDSYDGYIQTNQGDEDYFASDYIKVVYSVSGENRDDAGLLILQTFDTSWGGWSGIEITTGGSVYDGSSGTYTAYIPTAQVLATLTTGNALGGVNISFMNAEPQATLLSYSTLTAQEEGGEEDKEPITAEPLSPALNLYTITEEDLLGVDWQGASKVKVYVKMTEGGTYSVLNAMVKLGPDGEDGSPVGKASSKYLVGEEPLVSKSGNAIQKNLVGNAGTGNYVFPDVNLNKTMQDGSAWSDDYNGEITITVSAHTTETNCELLGLVFSNGAVYPEGFTAPVVEGATFDVVVEENPDPNRDKLQYAVDFVVNMDESTYEADSWAQFMAVVEEAKALLADSNASEDTCGELHAKLEKTKASMRFVMSSESSAALPWRDLTGDELVYEMGLGTNLGNTLDGHSGFTPSETAWQSAITTKAYITALHDAGYNTVRIPVTWGNMIDGDISSGYTINENWLGRVQQIVDYCVSQDMYAIINIHHDGAEQTGWLRVSSDQIDDVYYQYEQVWRIIAERFKDYDEHLIFESMNEITCMEGDLKNSAEAIAYDTPIIMNLNQIFVNVVRSTGSNNTTRWLAAVAHYANNGSNAAFSMPEDSYNENSGLMFAAHIYKHSTNVSWTYDQIYEVVDGLKRMANKFDVPMYLGEWGNRTYKQDGTESGYNDVERAYFCEIVTRACQVAGVVPCVWDQGFGNNGEYETGLYSYWNRTELRPIFKNIVDAMVRGIYLEASSSNLGYDFKDIVKSPTVTPITSIAVAENTVYMQLGDNLILTPEYAPAESNDVLLWSTDDDTVATVYRGIIRARGIGSTTVHVYSQSGSVKESVQVIVGAAESAVPATEILTDAQEYTVVANKTAQIAVTLDPVDSTDTVTFKSSNTAVAVVDALGKITGISEGTAYVTVTASSGVTKTVKVNVVSAENLDSVDLALHILYNDSTNSYWGCELSAPVTVNGDGTYTLSFDLTKEISAAAEKAGVTELKNLTAIYIKDLAVTKGEATQSPLESASIVYDSVKVNGMELTMKEHSPANCVNSGVFDSGKPVNAWDGSVVEEVTVSNYAASFTSVSNPTSIEVTFTLSNVVFVQPEDSDVTEAESITSDAEQITLTEVGQTGQLTVTVTPADADTLVTFLTSDASVVSVDSTGVALDENGNAVASVTATGLGTATVTAITDNGLVVEFTVTVEQKPVNPFTDVGENNRFKDAILWGYYNGIVVGKTATTFEPNANVNRAQFVMFLWRMAGCPAPKSDENPFTDVGENNRFREAILWAYHEGITVGKTETTFAPEDTCTRAQVAAFLYRYAGQPDVSALENPFEDVGEGSRFRDAIVWAYYTGITSGKTETTFAPSDICTRAHVVTFLYKYPAEN